MSVFLKQIIVFLIVLSTLNAAQARGGLVIFTQPDGTQFEGYLKGDSAFHWIESGSQVVIINPRDKFYYNARVNKNGNLECSSQRPNVKLSTVQHSAVQLDRKNSPDELNQTTKNALKKMQKEAKRGNHPR